MTQSSVAREVPGAAPARPLASWLIAAVLFAGTVLLFTRSLGYDFINYDDPRYVTHNAHVQEGLTADALKWAFTGNADYWHPLTWLSHVTDWSLYGDNAAGHRLTSILWHAVNAVLAFFVLRRLTGGLGGAAFCAALFAWHPLRVESVVWIAERKDVMSGCCFLLMLLAYLAYARRRQTDKPASFAYLATLGAFAAGLMCKPTLVTAPLVLLALDFWPLGRGRDDSSRERERLAALLLEKLPFFVLSAATAVLTIWMQKAVGAFTLSLPLGARLANVPVAITRYLAKLAWPTDLVVCYPHPGWWPVSTVLASTAVVVGITGVAWQWRQRAPWIAVGWVWSFALLLPTLGLVQVGFQSLADRYTYLPTLGWMLALLPMAVSLRPRRAMLVVVAATGALTALMVGAWRQQGNWRDSETLFRHALAHTTRNDVAEAALAFTLAADGRLEEAARHAGQALAVNPRSAMALTTLASIHERQQRLDEAAVDYRRALELNPDDTATAFSLAAVLLRRGQPEAAAPVLREAAQRKPGLYDELIVAARRHAAAHDFPGAALYFEAGSLLDDRDPRVAYERGVALLQLRDPVGAQRCFERAVALDPGVTNAHAELGFLLLAQQEPERAAAQFRAAVQGDPNAAASHLGLGRAEEALGHSDAATTAFARALQLAPLDADAHRAWGDVLARRRRFADAIPVYRRALELRPNDAALHAALGFALFLSDRREEAIREWRETLRLDPAFPGLRERLARLGEH